jgi:hypothetical protein
VSKKTYSRRLDDLNDLALKFLPSDRPLQLMDVAVSSGLLAMEWTAHLSSFGIEHSMVASDVCTKAFLVSLGRQVDLLVDRDGCLLHIDVMGAGGPLLEPWLPRSLYTWPLRKTVRTVLGFDKNLGRYLKGTVDHYQSKMGVVCRNITLASPRLRKFPSLGLIEDDITTNRDKNLENRFHVLRAANILNRSFLEEKTLIQSLYNLRDRLKTGGLLIVCRTDSSGVNRATIFRKNQDKRFEVMARLREGSDIEKLILSLK